MVVFKTPSMLHYMLSTANPDSETQHIYQRRKVIVARKTTIFGNSFDCLHIRETMKEKCWKYFYPRSFKNKYTEHGIKFDSVARQRYASEKVVWLKKLGWWCARAVHGWPLLPMELYLVEIEESNY